MSKKLEITLKRSVIGKKEGQIKTAQTLGLKKVNDIVVREDSPAVRGMLNKISHMVTVKEI
ncbi:50S ribosomal protein L30 [Virgibacillus alimentarius]|uniref:Large ribosomal subunit protein uL30 n=1 Tax=Virgibacillus alimentarius TaxID=698769 RepID=A0ABS4SAI9_9BACI|nr:MULTISPECIES: 50S ribosomal protein L30 [Virgibacillus]MBP2258020.1 large subunit ribosomal protein L30 [Virgibacillus alimentarius]HLR65912.1 50S ribosomal protein L30 [Virgibacillus sp.]